MLTTIIIIFVVLLVISRLSGSGSKSKKSSTKTKTVDSNDEGQEQKQKKNDNQGIKDTPWSIDELDELKATTQDEIMETVINDELEKVDRLKQDIEFINKQIAKKKKQNKKAEAKKKAEANKKTEDEVETNKSNISNKVGSFVSKASKSSGKAIGEFAKGFKEGLKGE